MLCGRRLFLSKLSLPRNMRKSWQRAVLTASFLNANAPSQLHEFGSSRYKAITSYIFSLDCRVIGIQLYWSVLLLPPTHNATLTLWQDSD